MAPSVRSSPLNRGASPFVSTHTTTVLARLFPDASTLCLEACYLDDVAAQLTLLVTSRQARVPCPLCTRVTAQVHSRYARTLADLPWTSYRVRLQRRVRQFFHIPSVLVVTP
jgi:transposase